MRGQQGQARPTRRHRLLRAGAATRRWRGGGGARRPCGTDPYWCGPGPHNGGELASSWAQSRPAVCLREEASRGRLPAPTGRANADRLTDSASVAAIGERRASRGRPEWRASLVPRLVSVVLGPGWDELVDELVGCGIEKSGVGVDRPDTSFGLRVPDLEACLGEADVLVVEGAELAGAAWSRDSRT